MDNEIIIKNRNLALLLKNTLEQKGNRDPKFNKSMDYKRFTLKELSTITKLELTGLVVDGDISELKYCINLKDLSIISANAKDVEIPINISDTEMNYAGKKNIITDFSVINKLTNLEFLSISYDDNLTELDVSNLKNLTYLNLNNNQNLKSVIGLENLTSLSDLTLYNNDIFQPFDLQTLMNNSYLLNLKLDFDMYPMIKKINPNIDEFISEQLKLGLSCKWQENISNVKTNQITTNKISQMNKKAKEILQEIILPEYSDMEKITAIYFYVIQNVSYDHESLVAAKKGVHNSAYEEASNNLSESRSTYLEKRQSSYNALIKGKAVCEGYANMMHYLLACAGIRSRTVSCSSDKKDTVVGKNSNHRVIRIELENEWYYFDPTWDSTTYAQKKVLKNFLKTKTMFSKNHVLSMTEKNIESPETRPYSKEEISKILRKVTTGRKIKAQSNSNTSYSKKDLIDNYKKAGINQEDLDNAYKNIDNSREKEEQNQEQSNDDLDDDFNP